jgi:hypothetical protein
MSKSRRKSARFETVDPKGNARQAVALPAANLLAVAVISCAFLVPSVAFDIYLLATGRAAEAIGQGSGIDADLVVQIRAFWGLAILVTSGYVAFGAWHMRRLKSFSHARRAALIATIPCLGPCCVIGIPFGFWCQRLLAKEEVRQAFEAP